MARHNLIAKVGSWTSLLIEPRHSQYATNTLKSQNMNMNIPDFKSEQERLVLEGVNINKEATRLIANGVMHYEIDLLMNLKQRYIKWIFAIRELVKTILDGDIGAFAFFEEDDVSGNMVQGVGTGVGDRVSEELMQAIRDCSKARNKELRELKMPYPNGLYIKASDDGWLVVGYKNSPISVTLSKKNQYAVTLEYILVRNNSNTGHGFPIPIESIWDHLIEVHAAHPFNSIPSQKSHSARKKSLIRHINSIEKAMKKEFPELEGQKILSYIKDDGGNIVLHV